MPGLPEALFNAGRKQKALSGEPSLASLPSSESLAQRGQEKQKTIFQEEALNSPKAHLARESQNFEQRFGQPHAKLFSLVERSGLRRARGH